MTYVPQPYGVAARGRFASKKPARKGKRRSWLRRILLAVLLLVIAFYGFIGVTLLALRVINPRFTGVQVQRRVES